MTTHHERCVDHTTCDGMIAARDQAIIKAACEAHIFREVIACKDKEIVQLRAALLPFAAAASRPGRLLNPMNDNPLEDGAVVGIAIEAKHWRQAMEVMKSD